MDAQYIAALGAPVVGRATTSTGHRYCACRCGAVVETSSRSVRYASAACAERARIARAAARSAEYQTANAAMRNWTRYLRHPSRAHLLTPARLAILETWRGKGVMPPAAARKLLGLPPAQDRAAQRVDPAWRLPAPATSGRIPGTAPCALTATIDGRRLARPSRTAPLHGALSTLDGRTHHDTDPRWSLVPVDAGYGWAVVWRDDVGARHMQTEHAARLGVQRVSLAIGGRGSLAWPTVAPGRSRVRLDTITPVVIRRTVRDATGKATGTHARAECNAESLVSALCQLAAWLGVEASAETLRVDVVGRETEPTSVNTYSPARAGRQLHGDGQVTGWSGWCVLDVNAPARWLLTIAALGWGLGGKTAFGFGAVRVRAVAQ